MMHRRVDVHGMRLDCASFTLVLRSTVLFLVLLRNYVQTPRQHQSSEIRTNSRPTYSFTPSVCVYMVGHRATATHDFGLRESEVPARCWWIEIRQGNG